MEKRKNFLISIAYFGIIFGLVFVALKYGFNYVMPVCVGFIIAYLLKAPIRYLEKKTGLNHKVCSFIVLTITIIILALIVVFLSAKLFTALRNLVITLPSIYKNSVEPYINNLLDRNFDIDFVELLGPTAGNAVANALSGAMSSIGSQVTNFSVQAVAFLTNLLSSFPSFLMNFLLTIISAYFVAFDYDRIVDFVVRQFDEKTLEYLRHFKNNFVDTIFKYLVSYITILFITFAELSLLMAVAGLQNPLVLGFSIAIFDILPIVGVATVLIPWIIIDLLSGLYKRAIIIAVGAVIITVVRNIIEPKIIGDRVGLHPVLTLVCMYGGLKLAGVLGMFAFPVILVCLQEMHKAGLIKLYK